MRTAAERTRDSVNHRRIVAIALTLLAVGCGKSGSTDPFGPVRLTLEPGEITLTALGEIEQLQADAWDAQGDIVDGVAMNWSTSDASIVSVSDDGWIEALSNGTASITARSGELHATAIVTVRQRPGLLIFTPDSLRMAALGEQARFVAVVADGNARPIVELEALPTWTSREPDVASVDGTGLVTANAEGRTVVSATATVENREIGGSAFVTVTQVPVEIRVTPSELHITRPYQDTTLSASAYDANGFVVQRLEFAGIMHFMWSSPDPCVGIDTMGRLYPHCETDATVSASWEAVEGTAHVVVEFLEPPAVWIDEPKNGAQYTHGSPIYFVARSMPWPDPPPGWTETGILWTSNLDGELGTGWTEVLSDLSIGTHTVTFSVFFENGSVSSDSILVEIVP